MEIRAVSNGVIIKCTHRKGLWLLNKEDEEVIVREGKEAILSAGDILKLNQDKYHYKVELKRKKKEDTDSEDEEDLQ